jgi:hypothetical protein
MRITPLPTASTTGSDLRAKLHTAADSLFCAFHKHIKVPIPVSYFTQPINDQIITTILKTKYVHACIPFFQDETDTNTTYTHANDLYKVLKDFPPGLIQPHIQQTNTPTKPKTTTPITDPYTNYINDDIAFLQSITNTENPETQAPPSIPNHVSTATKRPHHPSGTTVQPELRRSKQPELRRSKQPPQDQMEIDPPSTEHHSNEVDTESEEYRFLLNCNPRIRHSPNPHLEEVIPDSEYEFDLAHSQETRLEVRDALGIAKAISPTNYNKTIDYIRRHKKYINIDKLKQYATHPFPNNAHNDNTVSPNHS